LRWVVSAAALRGAAFILLLLAGCGDDDAPAAEASGPPTEPPAGLDQVEWGERLFRQQGCPGCHHVNGLRGIGGPLDGLSGAARTFADGSTGSVDEAYVRESIVDPGARVVEGFQDEMPSYRSLLSAAQLDALVAYVLALE
jgi:cytochrome c oxidase subunit 2